MSRGQLANSRMPAVKEDDSYMTAALTERAQSFGHLFVDRIEETPNREAFRYRVGENWKSMSWAQTKERVFDLAAGLVGLGVQPAAAGGDRVHHPDRVDPGRPGVMCAGGATTTVYPSTAREDVAYILADSESVVVFAEDAEQVNKVWTPTCRTCGPSCCSTAPRPM